MFRSSVGTTSRNVEILCSMMFVFSMFTESTTLGPNNDPNCLCPYGLSKKHIQKCGHEMTEMNNLAKKKVHQTTCIDNFKYQCEAPGKPAYKVMLCELGTKCMQLTKEIKPKYTERLGYLNARFCVNVTDLDIPSTPNEERTPNEEQDNVEISA